MRLKSKARWRNIHQHVRLTTLLLQFPLTIFLEFNNCNWKFVESDKRCLLKWWSVCFCGHMIFLTFFPHVTNYIKNFDILERMCYSCLWVPLYPEHEQDTPSLLPVCTWVVQIHASIQKCLRHHISHFDKLPQFVGLHIPFALAILNLTGFISVVLVTKDMLMKKNPAIFLLIFIADLTHKPQNHSCCTSLLLMTARINTKMKACHDKQTSYFHTRKHFSKRLQVADTVLYLFLFS